VFIECGTYIEAKVLGLIISKRSLPPESRFTAEDNLVCYEDKNRKSLFNIEVKKINSFN
tara:strand:- start:447 stop:623 length:177 start_codon:yes stop_codon:yes gene_type:complete